MTIETGFEPVAQKTEYSVHLSVFEGPLDLLLYLVNKAELEISKISISDITRQYLEYIDFMKDLNIDVAGEYLHMAATLLRLKARELLPYDMQGPEEGLDDEGGIYNKEQLIKQLLEYKKFKEAANSLKTYESELIGTFSRGSADEPPAVITDEEDLGKIIGNVTLFDLITAFKSVLTRDVIEEPSHTVRFDIVRVDDRIERILSLIDEKKEVRFEELFSDDMRRMVLVVTFMAILELVKMQQIRFRQESNFQSIFVERRPEEEREAPLPEDEYEGPTGIKEEETEATNHV